MKSKHKVRTIYYGANHGNDIEVEITFIFLKGAPAQGPSYASGGQPADPDEIEFVSIRELNGSELRHPGLEEWAMRWLAEDGFNKALEEAASDLEAQREQAMEDRRG